VKGKSAAPFQLFRESVLADLMVKRALDAVVFHTTSVSGLKRVEGISRSKRVQLSRSYSATQKENI